MGSEHVSVFGEKHPSGPSENTGPSRKRWGVDAPLHVTPGFALLYLAIGVMVADGVGAVAVYQMGHSGSSPGPTVPVANGAPASFELTAFLTGFVGVGGTIDGMTNPSLIVELGAPVTLTLVNGETMGHNIQISGYNVGTADILGVGSSAVLRFTASQSGSFDYYCGVPGHRESGMQGTLNVGTSVAPVIGPEAPLTVAQIARSPTDLPAPIARNYSTTVNIYLHTEEVTAELEPGTSFTYWTYNGTVPGPFFRVRVNDTVIVHFTNDVNSTMNHSVDFHAATGPGGGAVVTQTPPGGESTFSFLAMVPGLFVYHCGTPNIPAHIAMGMYGMILVEPEQGMSPVDHEFYFMQGEIYTQWPIQTKGNQLFNGTALQIDQPTYVTFNGAYRALTGAGAMRAVVNDSVRVFFGVGGPNVISSFHLIGAMFDTAYANGDLTDPPLHGLQTVLVAPGGSVVTEMRMVYPANYTFVDHSIVNAIDKGAVATLAVTGWANSSIFQKLSTDEVVAAAPVAGAAPMAMGRTEAQRG